MRCSASGEQLKVKIKGDVSAITKRELVQMVKGERYRCVVMSLDQAEVSRFCLTL